MNITPIIECAGFDMGRYSIPQFTVCSGEIVALIWPGHKSSKAARTIISIVSGKTHHHAVTLTGSVVHAKPVQFYAQASRINILTHIARRLEQYSAFRSGWDFDFLGTDRLAEFLDRLGYSRDCPSNALEGNARALIGLWIGFETASAVIYDTIGTVPFELYKEISRWTLIGNAAVEISYPVRTQLDPDIDCHPSARQIFVTTKHVEDTTSIVMQLSVMLSGLIDGRKTRDDVATWASSILTGTSMIAEHRKIWRAVNLLVGAALQDDDGEYVYDNARFQMLYDEFTR